MNPEASNVVVQGFLKGFFDVFDALLSLSFSFDPSEVQDFEDEDLDALLKRLPVVLRSPIKGGGAVAILLSMEDASKLVSLTNTGEPTVKDSLDEAELSTLQEIADSSLGGGVSNLTEKFGEDVELDVVEVFTEDTSADLLALLGSTGTAAPFEFSASPHFETSSAFLFSVSLEERVPDALVSAVFGDEKASSLADQALVSDDEMKDILSGFDGDMEDDVSIGDEAARAAHENLDVILDIELVATARLGRIEMPISEVLNLGPGSIIEVGRSVDEPVDLFVNNRLVARGDVVVVDEKFGLRITEIVSQKERIESLR